MAQLKLIMFFFDKTNNGINKIAIAYKTQRDFDLVEKDENTWELVKSEDGYFLYQRSEHPNSQANQE